MSRNDESPLVGLPDLFDLPARPAPKGWKVASQPRPAWLTEYDDPEFRRAPLSAEDRRAHRRDRLRQLGRGHEVRDKRQAVNEEPEGNVEEDDLEQEDVEGDNAEEVGTEQDPMEIHDSEDEIMDTEHNSSLHISQGS